MAQRLLKVSCMEHHYPGMWQRWFKHQCAAVGWNSKWGYHMEGESPTSGWTRARNILKDISPGDLLVVTLQNHRVGRIGQVTSTAVSDADWDPLVPKSQDLKDGEMGRRIFVRWDLTTGPDDRELVVALPEGSHFTGGELRPAIAEIRSQTVTSLRRVMNDPFNWVGLATHFQYERALSDYIAAYPHRLEDGLLPHPNEKIRERVFSDRNRLDVLLLDPNGTPVIVECKQGQPSTGDIQQLKHYLRKLTLELKKGPAKEKKPRGILVHGGARKLRADVKRAVRGEFRIELVQFRVDVDFVPSH